MTNVPVSYGSSRSHSIALPRAVRTIRPACTRIPLTDGTGTVAGLRTRVQCDYMATAVSRSSLEKGRVLSIACTRCITPNARGSVTIALLSCSKVARSG